MAKTIQERLEKIRSMRGALYRKVLDDAEKKKEKKKKQQLKLPGFEIKNIQHVVEFQKTEDVTKIDITYPLIEPFAYVNVKWDDEDKIIVYNVIEPEINEKDKDLLKKISESLLELVDVEISAVKNDDKMVDYLEKQIAKIIHEFGLNISTDRYTRVMYYVYRNFIGFNEIEPFLQDPNIEDISCDGINAPMYIVHRKFGSLKTNVVFTDLEYLREFVIKISQRAGRYVSYAEPVLEGTLPDGSRISATIAGDVATRGPTFTIRKFSERPFSPIEQLKFKTVSIDLMAYFWYITEHGASMLFVGGVATGKTSFMNAICMFIPQEAKIVSIEDTRELRIPNDHWVPTLSRVGFGIPMPSGEKYGGVSLFDLLRQSFRQNPDYVIVGETRGKEAYVMFQGMSSGHPSMSTFHAGSVDTVIKRLTTPPIDLSPSLVESLNVITVLIHAREKGKSARRIREIAEILTVDAKTSEVETNIVFQWDPAKDVFVQTNESVVIKELVEAKGGTVEDANKSIEERRKVLKWMFDNEITDYAEVTKIINRYYKESANLMKEIGDIQIPPIRKGKIASELRDEIAKKSASKAEGTVGTVEMKTQIAHKEKIKPEIQVESETRPKLEPEIVKEKPKVITPEIMKDETEKIETTITELLELDKIAEDPKKTKRAKRQSEEKMKTEKVTQRVSVLNLFGYKFMKEKY